MTAPVAPPVPALRAAPSPIAPVDLRSLRAAIRAAALMPMTQLRVVGGAMGRVARDATAFAHRDAVVMATIISGVKGSYEEATAWTEAYHADLSGGSTGVYSNFLSDEGRARVREAYPGATYERLVEVKRRVDPWNLFHGNHAIAPG